MNNIHHSTSPSHPPAVDPVGVRGRGLEAVMERAHHDGGRFLSGIICINILILGCALVSGSAFNSVAITAVHRQIFLIILVLLTTLWMIVYTVFTLRRDQEATFRDGHAGPVWLRAGLVLFGLLSLLMDIFKIATYVGYLHCESTVKVAFPVIQAVFLFVQTYFLWTHAKDCVQKHTTFTRCGLTLTLSTNLVVWMAAVTEESLHQTEFPDLSINVSHKMYKASYGDKECKCSHSACDTFKEAFYYLYPFNIEYSLFASALAYVMWKNVGRVVEDNNHHEAKIRLKDACLGSFTGSLLVVAGLVTFIIYEVEIQKEDEETRNKVLLIHFLKNVVIVSMMSVASVIGCVVYRLDRREHVSEENPTRSLDVWLLVGASMGQLVISYFTIVAAVATGARGHLNALNLTWAVLLVLQLGLQNYFIIEGLHREPFYPMRQAALHSNTHTVEHAQMNFAIQSSQMSLSWKRRVLKEVCAFLLLANIILWVMPAFGARPQFDHDMEIYFYKYTMWTAIVNIGLPFGIFYRMHCIASLFEVFLIS